MRSLITSLLLVSIVFSLTGVILAAPECDMAEKTSPAAAVPTIASPDCCCDASASYLRLDFVGLSAKSAAPSQTLVALAPLATWISLLAPAHNLLACALSMVFDTSPPASTSVLRI